MLSLWLPRGGYGQAGMTFLLSGACLFVVDNGEFEDVRVQSRGMRWRSSFVEGEVARAIVEVMEDWKQVIDRQSAIT